MRFAQSEHFFTGKNCWVKHSWIKHTYQAHIPYIFHLIFPALSTTQNSIIKKKVSKSKEIITWSCDVTRAYLQHGPKPTESCKTEDKKKELKDKTKYLSKLPLNKSISQKSSTVKSNIRRRQKKTNLSFPVETIYFVWHIWFIWWGGWFSD